MSRAPSPSRSKHSDELPVVQISETQILAKPGNDFSNFGHSSALGIFLWLKRGDAKDAITDIKILHREAEAPVGYAKLPSIQADGRTFCFYYQVNGTGEDCSPITQLQIVSGTDSAVPAGFRRVTPELNPGAAAESKEYLCIQSHKTKSALNSKEYTIGENLDVQDTTGHWEPAVVKSKMLINGVKMIRIHYLN